MYLIKNKLFKVLLTIFVFGFVIWLGGTIFRTSIAYNLFKIGPQMELKPEYTNIERINTIYLFSTTSLMTGIAYCLSVVSGSLLAVMLRKEFKDKGWIFIIFCLFVFTVPIQSYFLYMDYELANAVYYKKILDFYHPDIQNFFVLRFKSITNGSLRTMLLLSGFTCILYAVWQPLDNNNNRK